MKTFSKSNMKIIITAIFTLTLFAAAASAQTTVFTYQGRLTDASLEANGSYDFEFRLFDGAGTAIGAAQIREDIPVSKGVFTVELDAALFAANAFDGSSRLLEISVRRGSETGAFTVLAPRQPVTSTPYAIQSIHAATAQNSQSLGGSRPVSMFKRTIRVFPIRDRRRRAAASISKTGLHSKPRQILTYRVTARRAERFRQRPSMPRRNTTSAAIGY